MNESISILGIKTALASIQRNALKGLNADVLLRFFFYSAVFNGQSLCIIRAKNKEESIAPTKYKKIAEQVEAVVGMPVAVLLENSWIYVQRERLINQGVYFIVSDKYAFLPSLIANAQLKKKKKLDSLTPAAQYMLLYYLSDEKAKNKFTIKELEEITPYNYIAVARAVANLEDCGLCQAEFDDTRTKHIHFTGTKRWLWENAQRYLFSPVKKILYSDVKPEGNFSISGVNALSHYSHLNPDQYETVAVWDKFFNQENGKYNEIEGSYKIEVWKHPTTIPYQEKSGIVDKLSLYLSMKDESDPRIEKELGIMIEEMKW
jgi:hypothetical protein